MAESTRGRPLISVVVEGYNESLALGAAADTLEALTRQDFPLRQVEVILVGSVRQAEQWRQLYTNVPFACVKVVGADGAHYYELKNKGAQIALGDTIAFTDSDACPEPTWLSSIAKGIAEGADIVAGVTLFQGEDGRPPSHFMMQTAASISWGFVVGDTTSGGILQPKGFLSHNVGFRAFVFHRHRYRTDLGRTCAGSFLYQALKNSGCNIVLQPQQRVAHVFSLRWWIFRLHRRFGYEVFLLRRLNEADPKRWLARAALLEPLLTMAWHIFLDVPQWFRFSRLLGISSARRIGLLPVLIVLSVLARGSEMIGMYATWIAPQAMKRFAESN